MSLADLGNTLSGLSIDPAFNMGMGIMAASGPSLMPHSLGQSLAAGTQYAQAAREKAMQAQMMNYQLQQAAIMNGILRRATGGQQSPAQGSNLNAPSTNAGDAPMLASANGTAGTSYAAPGQPAAAPASADPVSSALQTPGGALQFVMDRPGFFGRVMPAPTDFVKTLQAAGIDPSSALGRQILQQNLAKQNYIAPVRATAGGGVYDPVSGRFTMTPKAIDGTVPVQLPNGQWAAQPVLGGQQAIAGAATAQASGRATFAPMTYTDAQGVQHTTTQAAFAGGAPSVAATPDQQMGALAAQATDMVKNGVPQEAAQAWLENKAKALGVGYQPAAQSGGAPNVAGPSAGFVAGQQSAATKAQGAPSKQMADSYGTLSNADSNYQQSRQAIEEMLGLAHSKGVTGAAVGVLPESVSTRISPDAAKYQKLHATYVALQGKALGSSGTDAARETIDEAVPTYDKPQSAMVAGLNTQLNNLDLAHIKTQFLTPVYQQGNEKAYTQQSAAFDRNITPDMAPILQMSGPVQRQAVAAAIKANPALKPRFEWAYNNGMLQ